MQERETCISVRGREGIVQRKRARNAAPEKIKENNYDAYYIRRYGQGRGYGHGQRGERERLVDIELKTYDKERERDLQKDELTL